MMNELCQEIKNYFDRGQQKFFGTIHIVNGLITNSEFTDAIKMGQYFRIVGSILNDGVYCYNNDLTLIDEDFKGAIWLMAVPRDVITLSEDIEKWLADNEKALQSPYQSESFGGYSYTKATGKSGALSWQDVFAHRLNHYRRARI